MQKVYILKAAAWTMTMSMADVFEMHSGDDLTPPPPPKGQNIFWLLTICKLQDKCIHFSMKKKNETFCLMMGGKQLKRFHFFKKSVEIKTYIFV